MSNRHIEAYHVEEAFPNKMTKKDTIPKKTTVKGKSTHKVAKKNRKPPPELVARKRNMDSDLGSEFDDDDNPGRDKELEEAQNGTFGRMRPNFANLKSEEENLKPSEKEKEDGEIQPAHDKDAGQYSTKEYKDWTETNKGKFL